MIGIYYKIKSAIIVALLGIFFIIFSSGCVTTRIRVVLEGEVTIKNRPILRYERPVLDLLYERSKTESKIRLYTDAERRREKAVEIFNSKLRRAKNCSLEDINCYITVNIKGKLTNIYWDGVRWRKAHIPDYIKREKAHHQMPGGWAF